MKAGMTIDARELQNALKLYWRATQKDESEILNRAGRNASLRAAQFTPKATGAKIRSALITNNLAVKILSSRGRFRGATMAQRAAITRKFVSARVRSARYVSAGWSKAQRAFGGRGVSVNPRSEAAKGFGIKATPQRLIAIIANNSRGAGKVGLAPLERAIGFVARDMTKYAQRKLAQTAKKFSARGAR